MAKLTYVQQAKFFGALAHPARLRILDILCEDEACVCHLSAALHQRQAYVSQQLAKLREAGLIVDRKDGLFVYYSLADANIRELLDEARQRLGSIAGGAEPLPAEAPPHGNRDCACPRCLAARVTTPAQGIAAPPARQERATPA